MIIFNKTEIQPTHRVDKVRRENEFNSWSFSIGLRFFTNKQ